MAGSATGSSIDHGERARLELREGRARRLGPQQRLGRDHDERPLRVMRDACERSRWKYWAAVEGTATRRLPRAPRARNRSNRDDECSGPWPS